MYEKAVSIFVPAYTSGEAGFFDDIPDGFVVTLTKEDIDEMLSRMDLLKKLWEKDHAIQKFGLFNEGIVSFAELLDKEDEMDEVFVLGNEKINFLPDEYINIKLYTGSLLFKGRSKHNFLEYESEYLFADFLKEVRDGFEKQEKGE